MNRGIILRYMIREILGLITMGVALFWSAGRLNWWPAWAALGIMTAWIAATAAVILHHNPALLAERLGPRRGAKRWDIAIMSLLGLTQLTRYILAGLDVRYGWSTGSALPAQFIALGVGGLGYALVVWATAVNAFFSQIMRIQTERGQIVVNCGPYHWVRHPAYLGAILFELAMPALFASGWVLIPSGLGVLLLILRTALEDRTLQAELPGYADYARQVRQRLLPGLW
ncbi:MAG TPA: isoprenylcysteine carboxylmethyltransferase family protein [Anaerolineaceae bacterium]|nr:isoprenylcysteine carboxylmethyltransferase family protein [Anaerolineaceae bacterium]